MPDGFEEGMGCGCIGIILTNIVTFVVTLCLTVLFFKGCH